MMMNTYDICIVSAVNDAEIADKLADSIRSYRLPADVKAEEDQDYRRIVLDTQETPFHEPVRDRLDECRFMVLICSSDAKKSSAVEERLIYFSGTHGRDHVIAVLVRDEPMDAFPESFIERKMVQHILPDKRVIERMETIEPIAADLRADTPERRKELLRYETVRIVASVMNLHPDDLERRHLTRRRKAVISLLSFAAVVTLVISAIFGFLGLKARREALIAEEQTRLSTETAERTMKDLPASFADEPQALEYIEEAVSHAKEALEELGLGGLLDQTESGAGS